MSDAGRGGRPPGAAQNGGNSMPAPGGDVAKLADDVANKMSLATLSRRPDVGRVGRPIALESNHFEIRLSGKVMVVQQYYVQITDPFRDKVDRDEKREAFFRAVDMNCGPNKFFSNKYEILYDGESICYTLSKFNFPQNPVGHFVKFYEMQFFL
uniref:Uncharacterized protein n=1 Tax=Plectus sambesii TaxID=2011161 RepID=A0A914WP77_9BILA